MKHPTIRFSSLVALLGLATSSALAQNGKLDGEGYIRDWLVLAPLSIGDSGGADALERKQFRDEASPKAQDGATQKAGDKELTWTKTTTPQFYIDFKELNPSMGEHVVGWAVAYVNSPDEKTGLTLKMNSNDQGKVYLNGKEVVKFLDTRTLEKDVEDEAPNITLKKGVNVIVLKVVNEENNWQGSVKLLDKAGKPVAGLKVQTKS